MKLRKSKYSKAIEEVRNSTQKDSFKKKVREKLKEARKKKGKDNFSMKDEVKKRARHPRGHEGFGEIKVNGRVPDKYRGLR